MATPKYSLKENNCVEFPNSLTLCLWESRLTAVGLGAPEAPGSAAAPPQPPPYSRAELVFMLPELPDLLQIASLHKPLPSLHENFRNKSGEKNLKHAFKTEL